MWILGLRRRLVIGFALIAFVTAALAWGTPGSGSTSTLVGRGTFQEAFKVKRKAQGGADGNWEVEVQTKSSLDIATQVIDFPPGAHSGWHSHPGPVFILVKTGTMTFYSSDDPTCSPTVRHAGEGFLDVGDHAHIARNEDPTVAAQNVVTYFAPPGAALRIDQPNPGNCPF
jgi:hypothetical protein